MIISSARILGLLGIGSLTVLGASAMAGCGDSGTGSGGASSSTTSVTTATTSVTTTAVTSTATATTGAGGSMENSPIDAPDQTWTYVPFANSQCMAGTPTGIGINKLSTSKKVMIFLQGGNACFNLASCAVTAHKNGFSDADWPQEKTDAIDPAPYFDRTNAQNPMKDYNYVYVPYCTGDLHFGDNDVMLEGSMRHFHGYNNMVAYLKRVVATFPDATDVIISGVSAGGFGAALNYDQVARAFPSVKVTLIDDSGPPMEDPTVPNCLQKLFYDDWGFSKTLPTQCTDCKPTDEAFLKPFVEYVTSTYPDARLGLISSTSDATISNFLGFAHDNCAMTESLVPIGAGVYAAGLADLRDNMLAGKTNFKLFLIDGVAPSTNSMTQHVWLNDDPSTVNSHGVTLLSWLNDDLSGSANWVNVPAN